MHCNGNLPHAKGFFTTSTCCRVFIQQLCSIHSYCLTRVRVVTRYPIALPTQPLFPSPPAGPPAVSPACPGPCTGWPAAPPTEMLILILVAQEGPNLVICYLLQGKTLDCCWDWLDSHWRWLVRLVTPPIAFIIAMQWFGKLSRNTLYYVYDNSYIW